MKRLAFYQRLSFYLLLGSLVLATGCSTVRTVPVHAERDHIILQQSEEVSSMEESAAKAKAYIRFADEKQVGAVTIRVALDSISWGKARSLSEIDRWSTSEFYGKAQWSKIASVSFVSGGRGALDGLGIGLLIGASLGALIGYIDGDDPQPQLLEPESWISLSAEEKAIFGGAVFGALGGLVGVVVGAAKGHRYVYVLDIPDEQSLRAVHSPFDSAHRPRMFQDDSRSVRSARSLYCTVLLRF